MTDPRYPSPPPAPMPDRFEIADHVGDLIRIRANRFQEQFSAGGASAFGPKDTVFCDVEIVDGSPIAAKYHDQWLSNVGIVGQLKMVMNQWVFARVAMKGRGYVLADTLTEADKREIDRYFSLGQDKIAGPGPVPQPATAAPQAALLPPGINTREEYERWLAWQQAQAAQQAAAPPPPPAQPPAPAQPPWQPPPPPQPGWPPQPPAPVPAAAPQPQGGRTDAPWPPTPPPAASANSQPQAQPAYDPPPF